jgi:uncharacterized protein YecE (DUF72 family)
MLHIGCSGFPVPATRYLREFMLEEVADTHLGVPGPALVRRWKREAPTGFVFTALCPKELTADHFKPSAAAEAAWDTFLPVARELDARAVVVTSNPDTPPGKGARAQAHGFFEKLVAHKLPMVIWEPPATWDLKECETTVKDLKVLVARDPLRHPPFAKGAIAYYRLPGPAGFKSRYEDPAIDQVAEAVQATQTNETFVVFANVDMYADARRLRRALGL